MNTICGAGGEGGSASEALLNPTATYLGANCGRPGA
jgi:hypothetical protein